MGTVWSSGRYAVQNDVPDLDIESNIETPRFSKHVTIETREHEHHVWNMDESHGAHLVERPVAGEVVLVSAGDARIFYSAEGELMVIDYTRVPRD